MLATERSVRLATGLCLFAYAASHFASHATGLFGPATMEAVGRNFLLLPWRTWPVRCALFGSLLIHGSLGLRALYRRRHLRIPPAEAWQLGLGLLIPLLLIPHATNVRLGYSLFGLDDSYYRILYQYWITPPWTGFARQLCLLFAVWLHGCVGLYFWLRTKPWYLQARLWLLSAATLLPFLAILGLVNGGWSLTMAAALQPGFAAAHGPAPAGSDRALAFASLKALWWQLQLLYIVLVAAVLGLRLARNLRARRSQVRITYPDGRIVGVPAGFSILEASRWAGIPHASICGGRGRCSTCRVRIVRGLGQLPAPGTMEQATLQRVSAAPEVRLACQVRPTSDLCVSPLLPAGSPALGLRVAGDDGRELLVTALYIDMRESTRLAAGRLPFDALFIVDRYVQRVTGVVQANGGHVTSVAGDGIMSVFGAGHGVGAAAGAAGALQAALEIWEGVDRLSEELQSELEGKLTFGMGLHSGDAAVGSIQVGGRMSLQFLGDTGNVAARLESMTKDFACTAIISVAVFEAAGRKVPEALPCTEVQIRGREHAPVSVILLHRSEEARTVS